MLWQIVMLLLTLTTNSVSQEGLKIWERDIIPRPFVGQAFFFDSCQNMDPLFPIPLSSGLRPPTPYPLPRPFVPRFRRSCKEELAFFPPSAFDLFKSFVLKANEPKQQYPHWNIFYKRFFSYSLLQKQIVGNSYEPTNIGLIFKF